MCDFIINFQTSYQCWFRHFQFDPCGYHRQTCQIISVVQYTHDWVGYRLISRLGSVGHLVKNHKINPKLEMNTGTSRSRRDILSKSLSFFHPGKKKNITLSLIQVCDRRSLKGRYQKESWCEGSHHNCFSQRASPTQCRWQVRHFHTSLNTVIQGARLGHDYFPLRS